MITNIDDETLEFLMKKGLSFNQFCICLLVFHKNATAIIKYTAKIGYLANGSLLKPNGKTRVNELDDLVERGYLKLYREDLTGNERNALDNFLVTEKFTAGFLDDFKGKADEFYNTYPINILINNEPTPVAKIADVDQIKKDYIKLLKQDATIHDKVMKQLRGIKYAKMKITNYLLSRYWEQTQDAPEQRRTKFL